MSAEEKLSRKEHILQTLAHMLETRPGERITTAALANEVGVSEAALYRHFPSKARMFEDLIAFIEETLFTRINGILQHEPGALGQCEKILLLVLTFAEKNPGITRILNGDALQGETERLRQRVCQVFDRLETQLRQLLREAELREGLRSSVPAGALASLLLAYVEGRVSHYVRSDFRKLPTEFWTDQWEFLQRGMFRD